MRGVTFPRMAILTGAGAAARSIFASKPNRSWRELLADYARFAKWCECSRAAEDDPRPAEPILAAGDVYWQHHFSALPPAEPTLLPDLDEFVRAMAHLLRRGLRCSSNSFATAQRLPVRHTIIKRAVICGCRRADIAQARVSESTVSKVVRSLFELRPIRTTGNFRNCEPKSKAGPGPLPPPPRIPPEAPGKFGSRRGTAIRLLCRSDPQGCVMVSSRILPRICARGMSDCHPYR